ncbi:hypothetical protein, partial [Pseudaminobacter soli (ex Li et al. 2025)]|uniref:hypothetical protein n=1 Tax=Pseudaminobacter soli (ex Li et al. 2025) TaxID=1295366 RepID=UPI001AECC6E3
FLLSSVFKEQTSSDTMSRPAFTLAPGAIRGRSRGSLDFVNQGFSEANFLAASGAPPSLSRRI